MDAGQAIQTTSQLLQHAADHAGVDTESVARVQFELSKLREQGILVDVTVGGTTLFSRRVSLSELGIPRKSVRGQNITAGSRFMAPPEFVRKQASMAERMRSLAKKYGQEVTGFAPYSYIYWKSYTEFKERWSALLAEFEELKREAIENLGVWRTAYVETCREMAEEAWVAIRGRSRKKEVVIELPNGVTRKFVDREGFVGWIVERAKGTFPTRGRVQAMMRADYSTAVLLSPADIQAEHTRLLEEEARAVQASADREEAHAREYAAEKARRVADSEADIAMRAIYDAELAHAREQLAQIASPFEELFHNLRAQVYHDAVEITRSIQKNGFLNPQVGSRIENLIELFTIKNATGDQELTDLLDALRSWTEQCPKQTGRAGKVEPKNTVALAQLSDALDGIVQATHESAVAVADRERAGRDLAVLEM